LEGNLELEQFRKEQQLFALDLPDLEVDLNLDLDAFLPAASPATSCMNDQDQSGVPSHRPAAFIRSPNRPTRVIWTVADKKALMAGIRKHKNSWSKMVADSTLLFSDDLIKSSPLPKVMANKLKTYARSPGFKSFLESVDNNKSS
jgi:hypothetical protein